MDTVNEFDIRRSLNLCITVEGFRHCPIVTFWVPWQNMWVPVDSPLLRKTKRPISESTQWHVTRDGKPILLVQRETLGEAIEQVQIAIGESEGKWSGHLYPGQCKTHQTRR